MNRPIVRIIAVWVATVATIAVNALANALPINNQATGDIANQFRGEGLNYWLPAGYVFAIWAVIYVGWIAYAIFQTLPAQRNNPRLARIAWLYVIASLANIVWLLFFHYNQFILSMLAMVVLLLMLIAIYLVLNNTQEPISKGERWMVRLPFSIYLGWITVATVANAAHVFVSQGWTGGALGPLVWLLIMYVVALVLATLMALTRRDVAYLLVLVWAFLGIAVNYSNLTGVLVSSILAALIVLGLAVLAGARTLWQGKTYAA